MVKRSTQPDRLHLLTAHDTVPNSFFMLLLCCITSCLWFTSTNWFTSSLWVISQSRKWVHLCSHCKQTAPVFIREPDQNKKHDINDPKDTFFFLSYIRSLALLSLRLRVYLCLSSAEQTGAIAAFAYGSVWSREVTAKRSTVARPGQDAVLKGYHDLQAPAFWEEEIGVMMWGIIESRCHD